MKENLLAPLPGFRLPYDYPWRVGIVSAVEAELRRLRASGRFQPPRFFRYYFRQGRPVGVCGPWTVALETNSCAMLLHAVIGEITQSAFSISADEGDPDFLLVHDRRDGACWLWRFRSGLRFVEATEPVDAAFTGWNDAEDWNLLGP